MLKEIVMQYCKVNIQLRITTELPFGEGSAAYSPPTGLLVLLIRPRVCHWVWMVTLTVPLLLVNWTMIPLSSIPPYLVVLTLTWVIGTCPSQLILMLSSSSILS